MSDLRKDIQSFLKGYICSRKLMNIYRLPHDRNTFNKFDSDYNIDGQSLESVTDKIEQYIIMLNNK